MLLFVVNPGLTILEVIDVKKIFINSSK